MTTHKRGLFITIEGIEGVGKSTAMQTLADTLAAHNIAHRLTREPGGTPLAEKMREVILTPHDEPLTSEAELLLLFAGRAQHLAQVIKPALTEGAWVVCDRFIDATYAYQGGGRELSCEQVAQLDQWIVGPCQPDVTFLLHAPVELALTRMKQRGNLDRIEAETQAFFTRVQAAYHERAQQAPARFQLIDAAQPLEQVQQTLATSLTQLIESWRS